MLLVIVGVGSLLVTLSILVVGVALVGAVSHIAKVLEEHHS